MKKAKPRAKQKQVQGNNISNRKNSTPKTVAGLFSMTNWLIILVLILPIAFSRQTMDPTVSVRYILLSGFILLFILFFFIWHKTGLNLFPGMCIKIVFALGAAFALWSMVTAFSAINPAQGYYEVSRHLLNLLLLVAVATAMQQDESQLLKLCKAMVVVSLVQSCVGILQYAGIAFTDLPGANAKPFGLMANRNLFGSAQAFLLPFSIYVLYKSESIWKYLASIAIIGILVSVTISQTRSAWLATAAIFIVSLILVIIFSPSNRKKWILAAFVALIISAGTVKLLLVTDKGGVLSRSVKERAMSLANAAPKQSESLGNEQDRLQIWHSTIRLIKDHPVFGVGPGNWQLAIPVYTTPGMAWTSGKYVPDRPHNVYLQVTSDTGIPGAILYFGMWLMIAFTGFKTIFNIQSDNKRVKVILMLAGLAAFATDCFFSFPAERIEHSLYIFLMAGIILGCYANVIKTEEKKYQPLNKTFLVAFVLIAAFNLFIGFKKYNFEKSMNYAKAYEDKQRYADELEEAEAGKSTFVTLSPETAVSLEIRTSTAYQGMKQYDEALREIKKARQYHPNSARVYNAMGTIYTDMQQYDEAIECYQKALQFTPGYDVVMKNLAANYFTVKNYAACVQMLGKIDINGDEYLAAMLNEAKRQMGK